MWQLHALHLLPHQRVQLTTIFVETQHGRNNRPMRVGFLRATGGREGVRCRAAGPGHAGCGVLGVGYQSGLRSHVHGGMLGAPSTVVGVRLGA